MEAKQNFKQNKFCVDEKPDRVFNFGNSKGFTLIELLVVIAIIGILASVAFLAFQSSRMKARDAKRLSDMTQMSTAIELYFNSRFGYPTVPEDLVPNYVANAVTNPQPADGDCSALTYPVTGSPPADNYYYFPSPTGGSYVHDGVTVYPDYVYFFCLGGSTGTFAPGVHFITPQGVQ